ncbi:MAG: M56 family metallopeptidase [Gemmatimonadota bacterium]|nr:M56 family metallopeptidase [Gemmatimonadota bacterium]
MTVWLLTFLVHSTLWCGMAWLILRLFPRTHARLRETIWYTALAASLITPVARAVNSQQSAVWQLRMPALAASAEGLHSEGKRGHVDGAASVSVAAGQQAAGILWFTVAGGLVTVYLVRLRAMRRRIVHREPVVDRRACDALAALSRRAALDPAPRLTESHSLGSPIAIGVGARREICVPVRALHELDGNEWPALLGHEVAHHLRRDTIRLAVLNVLQSVFFFQPLFRLAARELQLAAEEQCDDWAASQLDDPLSVASCLAEVAGWVVPRDRCTPVPCFGRHRRQLELRVRRLMDEDHTRHAPSRGWRRAGSVALLAIAPLAAPAIAPAGEASHGDGRSFEHVQQEHGEMRERAAARGWLGL